MFPHMVAAATPLPSLPAPDEAVLTRLFETAAPSLTDLFKSLTQNRIDGAPQTLLDLCRWSQRPDISAWLDFHASQLSAAIRRRRIAKLEEIADTSKDLVEQRRACTTALRALTQSFTRRITIHDRAGGGASPPEPSSPYTASLSDETGAAFRVPDPPPSSVSRGVPAPVPHASGAPSEPRPSGSGSLQPPAAPITAQSARQPASSPVHPLTCSPVHPSHDDAEPTHQPASSPLHPSTHSPRHSSPDSLLELAVSHIQTPRDPASITALAGALAPNATINTIAADPHAPQAAFAALPTTTSNLVDIELPAIESTEDTFSWSSAFTYAAGDRTRFRLKLTRINDHWLISSLDHHKLESDSS
jgi:hypothetical protein